MKNRSGLSASLQKSILLAAGLVRRLLVLSSCRRYDAIWIHREAFPFFTPLPERFLRQFARGRLVLDFDDALYARPLSGRDWRSWGRNPRGFAQAIRYADTVIAGSPVLVDWAAGHGVNASFVPTCVDTRVVRPRQRPRRGEVTIGWIGTWSTAQYLPSISDALARVAATHSVRLLFVGAANLHSLVASIPGAEIRTWTEDRELHDLSEFDVGIMPVPDTEWNRGKCAYKLIQYMAAGIPFVASPVGMNRDVAESSHAGLLCAAQDEWVDALTRLVCNQELRERLGAAGRAYALRHYDRRLYASSVM
ncbi:MAG: glycosyltransferase, partial [Candidatus Limnocylindrales bacterium]